MESLDHKEPASFNIMTGGGETTDLPTLETPQLSSMSSKKITLVQQEKAANIQQRKIKQMEGEEIMRKQKTENMKQKTQTETKKRQRQKTAREVGNSIEKRKSIASSNMKPQRSFMNLFDKGLESVDSKRGLRSQKSDAMLSPKIVLSKKTETDMTDEENAIFDDDLDIPFSKVKEVRNSVTPIRGTKNPSHNKFKLPEDRISKLMGSRSPQPGNLTNLSDFNKVVMHTRTPEVKNHKSPNKRFENVKDTDEGTNSPIQAVATSRISQVSPSLTQRDVGVQQEKGVKPFESSNAIPIRHSVTALNPHCPMSLFQGTQQSRKDKLLRKVEQKLINDRGLLDQFDSKHSVTLSLAKKPESDDDDIDIPDETPHITESEQIRIRSESNLSKMFSNMNDDKETKKKELEDEYYKTKQKYELLVRKSMSPTKKRANRKSENSAEPIRTENSEVPKLDKRERVSISGVSNSHSAEVGLKSKFNAGKQRHHDRNQQPLNHKDGIKSLSTSPFRGRPTVIKSKDNQMKSAEIEFPDYLSQSDRSSQRSENHKRKKRAKRSPKQRRHKKVVLKKKQNDEETMSAFMSSDHKSLKSGKGFHTQRSSIPEMTYMSYAAQMANMQQQQQMSQLGYMNMWQKIIPNVQPQFQNYQTNNYYTFNQSDGTKDQFDSPRNEQLADIVKAQTLQIEDAPQPEVAATDVTKQVSDLNKLVSGLSPRSGRSSSHSILAESKFTQKESQVEPVADNLYLDQLKQRFLQKTMTLDNAFSQIETFNQTRNQSYAIKQAQIDLQPSYQKDLVSFGLNNTGGARTPQVIQYEKQLNFHKEQNRQMEFGLSGQGLSQSGHRTRSEFGRQTMDNAPMTMFEVANFATSRMDQRRHNDSNQFHSGLDMVNSMDAKNLIQFASQSPRFSLPQAPPQLHFASQSMANKVNRQAKDDDVKAQDIQSKLKALSRQLQSQISKKTSDNLDGYDQAASQISYGNQEKSYNQVQTEQDQNKYKQYLSPSQLLASPSISQDKKQIIKAELKKDILTYQNSSTMQDESIKISSIKKSGIALQITDTNDQNSASLAEIFKNKMKGTKEKLDKRIKNNNSFTTPKHDITPSNQTKGMAISNSTGTFTFQSNLAAKKPAKRTNDDILEQRKLMMKSKVKKKLDHFSTPGEQQPQLGSGDERSASSNRTTTELLNRLAMGQKQAIDKKEMKSRTQKNYENLPEIKKQKEEERKRDEAMRRKDVAKQYAKQQADKRKGKSDKVIDQ